AGRKQKPALATKGKGGLKEAEFGGYLVASASAPGSGTTAERIPILEQRKYTTAPTMKASTGATGAFLPRLGMMPTRNPSAHAIQPAGLKPARGPVHHHGATDRTKGSADQAKDTCQIPRDTSHGQDDADHRADSDRDERVNLGHGRFETVGGNKRREAGAREGCQGQT